MIQSAKTALVTGGGAGIGRATCLHLARNGRAVGVFDRDSAAAEGVAQEIIDTGGKAAAVTADIARCPQIEAALAKIPAVLGPITILVNNAGVQDFCAFEDIAEDVLDRLTDVNLRGNYHVKQLVLPDLIAAGWGRIVNLSALGAQVAAPNMVHYTATKGGVIAMTRSLAIELGSKGIRSIRFRLALSKRPWPGS